jgi:hypothetical protein
MVDFLMKSEVGLQLRKKIKQIASFQLTLRALPKSPYGSSKSIASCLQEASLSLKNGKTFGFSYAVTPLRSSLFSCHMDFLALR